jgi:MoaA/NifB/PqqE/SkfB family radical SAM enzyme
MSDNQNNKDPSKTICRDLWSYPVIELTRPRIRTCCRRGGTVIDEKTLNDLGTDVFLNLPETLEDRIGQMKGEKVDGCKVCWNMEDSGIKSWRLGSEDWQFHFNRALSSPEKFRPFVELVKLHQDPSIVKSYEPSKLDISLGTYCDLKCLYCNSDYSTLWESETRKFGFIYEDPSNPSPYNAPSINSLSIPGYYEKFIEWFDSIYLNLERIAFMGGEPTYSPLFEKLTEHIVSKLQIRAKENVGLTIVTNLNWNKRTLDYVLKLREKIPSSIRLTMEVSMESHGARAEYIRNGVNWERFLYNLKRLAIVDNIEIKILPTLNALCITSIKEYFEIIREIELASDKIFTLVGNTVTYPKWLSFELLDKRHLLHIVEVIDWLQTTYTEEELKYKRQILPLLQSIHTQLGRGHSKQSVSYFYKWITEIDRRRNQSFVATFPELAHIYELGKEYENDKSIVVDLDYLKL